MSDLEKKIDELKDLMDKHIEEDDKVHDEVKELQKPAKRDWTRLLGVGITIVVLVAGIITSWATNKAAVAEIQKDQAKIEKRIEKAETDIHDVQLKAVHDSSILESVKEDVTEIKQDVKRLLGQ
jgi:peptidoglycan hydrolase CwlO-like protein